MTKLYLLDEADLVRALMDLVYAEYSDVLSKGDVIQVTVKAAVAPGFEDTGERSFVYSHEAE